jgi:hypothetical protein
VNRCVAVLAIIATASMVLTLAPTHPAPAPQSSSPASPTVLIIANIAHPVVAPERPRPDQPIPPPAPPATSAAVATPEVSTSRTVPASTAAAFRSAYINTMYLTVVPASQRAALAGRYVLGYDLAGLSCGTGCTGLFDGQARSSFNDVFFSESLAYQRNTLAHEAAHAYGFLFIDNYTMPSWAEVGGWQTEFNRLDRDFAGPYDAEAWAACIAWEETGFNPRINQIAHVCTPQAAATAIEHIR